MRGEIGTAGEHLARRSPSRPVGLPTDPRLTLPGKSLPSNADPVFEGSSAAKGEVELAARRIDRHSTRRLSCRIEYRCASRLAEINVVIRGPRAGIVWVSIEGEAGGISRRPRLLRTQSRARGVI